MEQVFKDNPKLDVAYKTSDGKYFFLENDAQNHASTLEDKKVEKVIPKKETSIAPTEIIQEDNEVNLKKAELLSLELSSKNYNKMLSLVKFFELETKDNKADSLIEVLTDYKNTIQEQ